MTISEIRDHLAKYCGEGKGDAQVFAAYQRDNPMDANCIVDILFIESRNGEYFAVLQMD